LCPIHKARRPFETSSFCFQISIFLFRFPRKSRPELKSTNDRPQGGSHVPGNYRTSRLPACGAYIVLAPQLAERGDKLREAAGYDYPVVSAVFGPTIL
jgi:hypothetical protein